MWFANSASGVEPGYAYSIKYTLRSKRPEAKIEQWTVGQE